MFSNQPIKMISEIPTNVLLASILIIACMMLGTMWALLQSLWQMENRIIKMSNVLRLQPSTNSSTEIYAPHAPTETQFWLENTNTSKFLTIEAISNPGAFTPSAPPAETEF